MRHDVASRHTSDAVRQRCWDATSRRSRCEPGVSGAVRFVRISAPDGSANAARDRFTCALRTFSRLQRARVGVSHRVTRGHSFFFGGGATRVTKPVIGFIVIVHCLTSRKVSGVVIVKTAE